MANNLNRLGGGVASAVPLRNTPVSQSTGSNSEVSSIMSGINDIIQTVTKVKVAEDIKRTEEDRIRAVSQAESEHLDTNNALVGGSYDSNLNTQVDAWRSEGLMESEIRLKVKDYKMNKSVTDLGLGEGGKTADNADIAYFDTYSKLELKAINPLLQEDRKAIQSKINNMTSSYIRTSSDDLQTKLNNVTITNKSYGMGESEAMALTIQSAFDLAKRGDESILHQLDSVKDSNGNKVLDTIEGSSIYSKLSDNFMQYKEHQTSVARKEKEFNQEVEATKIYTNMVDSGDLSSFKLNLDNALESGSINMQQHSSLNTYYKTAINVDAFPKQSDRATYIKAYSLAEQGTLKTDDLMTIQGKLSNSDFELIARTAISKGGINGLGNDESTNLNHRIKDDTIAYSGSAGINDISLTLNDKMIFSKRAGYIQQNLSNAKDSFIASNRRLPTDEEYTRMRDTVVSQAEKVYNGSTIKQPETIKLEPIKSDNMTGRADILNNLKTMKSKEDVDNYMKSLTPQQLKLLKGE